ncbi:Heparin-sulfate lyase precursor [Novipirellula aureliae]|uniref:Heparin-sulfate lyase n=1 Tax=Novipirellula aureliae TaxID=2527966 RepID=A0A5C6DLF9_9BACT|nr:alginate lyase family protein [Novipirellula aureliae]TWU36471.1 Heparin-sulfate lyase precursor [Novipirellula aureliae]
MQDIKTFFSWLDLDRKGLEAVKAEVERNNDDAAAEALLAYFRTRDNVTYYDGWEKPKPGTPFDTTKADAICRNHLVHVDLPEDIDWHADPHGDPEWTYCLNRHEFLTELGRAYWYTGDEKYTQAWKRILGDWIVKNPMPDMEWMLHVDGEVSRPHFMKQGTWRPLTIGIRMYTSYVPCFYHFLDSPELTPKFLVTMLTSMVEHARHTRLYYTRHKSYFNVSPNWGLMESNGLAHMGILFPEFKEALDWKAEAMSRFEEQIRMQICEEGMQVERASGYHLVCTFCFTQILDLALRNQVRVSDTYMANAEKMIDFVVSIMKPHGVYPMLKDADESDVFGERASGGLWEDINNLNMLEDHNDLRWVLKAGARLFHRPDMLWIATHGEQGEKPTLGSLAMPDSGFAVMRSGWDHDDLYCVYTCGELGVMDQSCVHGNADALSVDISGHGETLLIDPGRYLYEGPWRVWFKSTAAHNSITVDGQDSSELADEWMFKTKAKSTLRCFSSTEKFDYVDGSHDGFERLGDPVTHRRRVVFVKPHFWLVVDELTAKAQHQYDQYWHFGPEAQVTEGKDLSVTAIYQNEVGILVKPVRTDGLSLTHHRGSEDPIQGWVSYDYAVKVPAPALQYRRTAGQTTLATLLVPFQAGDVEVTAKSVGENHFEVANRHSTFVILLGDGTPQTIGDFEFDAEMLCAEFDADGKLADCSAAKASLIKYQGQTILDATVRHKVDRSNTLS